MGESQSEAGPGPFTLAQQSRRAVTRRQSRSTASARPTSGPVDLESQRVKYLSHLDNHIQTSYRESLGITSNRQWTSTHCIPWSQDTKSLFFASLSRHSRLRTDLIASDLGKSESEVVRYLNVLRESYQALKRAHEAERGTRDRRKRWKGSHLYRNGFAPSAREVSDAWIREEEGLAEWAESDVARKEHEECERVKIRERDKDVAKVNSEIKTLNLGRWECKTRTKDQIDQLERQWKLEEWGERLDAEKLKLVDGLMRPYWSEWYSRRLNCPIPDIEIDPADEDGSSKPNAQAKMVRDDAILEQLEAIPKRERSREQAKIIDKLKNRKRNRLKARIKCLIEAGKTEEEIKEEGGVDQAYLKWKGWEHRVPDLPDTNAVSVEQVLAASRSASPTKSPVKHIKSEPDLAVASNTTLRRLGVDEYILKHELHVLNFEAIAAILATRVISLEYLNDLHREFLAYLKGLILHVIVLAEAEVVQSPKAEDHSLDNAEEPEIHGEHVAIALANRGELPSKAIKALGIPEPRKQDWGSHSGRTAPYEVQQDDSGHDVEFLMDANAGDGIDTSDDEELQLDSAQDEIDEAYDAVHEAALWESLNDNDGDGNRQGGKEGEVKEKEREKDIWHDDPWSVGSTRQFNVSVGEWEGSELLLNAERAKSDYAKLLNRINKARRRRHPYVRPPVIPPKIPKTPAKQGRPHKVSKSSESVGASTDGSDSDDSAIDMDGEGDGVDGRNGGDPTDIDREDGASSDSGDEWGSEYGVGDVVGSLESEDGE